MISNTCKYAIRAVIYLAIKQESNRYIGMRKISKDLDIPAPFLGKILQRLAKQKLLNSTKGPHGGFNLVKPARHISLFDIIKIIDGDDLFTQCMIGLKVCAKNTCDKSLCAFHQHSDPVRKQILKVFKTQTIGELAEKFEPNITNIKI